MVLLEIVLENNLVEFQGEYFQQIFGIIMGTNVAHIIANLHLAKLEKNLKENPSMILKWFGQYFLDVIWITDLAKQKDQKIMFSAGFRNSTIWRTM